MVADLVFNRIVMRVGKDHAPRSSMIFATPQRHISRVDYVIARGIKGERVSTRKQVEHAPGIAVVMCDVGTGHVAMLDHCVRIVRADGWGDHRSASTWTNNFPGIEAGGLSPGRGHQSSQHERRRYTDSFQ